MVRWRTDEPKGKIILARLDDKFCGGVGRYALLYFTQHRYPHYAEDGEEIPVSAIDKWALIEE